MARPGGRHNILEDLAAAREIRRMASEGQDARRRELDLATGGGSVVGLGDAELLGRFVARRGDAAEAAFAAIVARHGPMVLATCRGRLRHPSDADDAFQATFLILVAKAGSVRVDDSLGPWLHGVARRVAARAAARRARSRELTRLAAVAEPAVHRESDDFDARAAVLAEVDALPAKYRAAVVLCHFEGLAHEEAARRLGWPVGTLSGRLSRARDLLRARLQRRGFAVPVLNFAARAQPVPAVPTALIRSTARLAEWTAAGRAIPAALAPLTRGTLIAMTITKWKAATILGLALGTLTVAAGYVAGQAEGLFKAARAGLAPPPPGATKVVAPREPAELARARLDLARRTYAEVGDLILSPPQGTSVQVNASLRTDQLAVWSTRWMEAERDLDPSKAGRIKALRGHIDRLTTWDALVAELLAGEASGLGPHDHATLKYHLLQAEAWLGRETP